MSRKVAWGVLGTARIGTEHVIPAMQRGELSTVAAIASRDGSRARAVADRLGIGRVYGSYEDSPGRPCHRGGLQPAAQPPPRALEHQGAGGGQARPVRETRCARRRAGPKAGRRRRTDRTPRGRGLHGAPPPAVADGPGHRARRAHRRGARRPDALLLLPHRSREHPEPGRHRRWRALRRRLLRRQHGPLRLRGRARARDRPVRQRPGHADRPHDERPRGVPRPPAPRLHLRHPARAVPARADPGHARPDRDRDPVQRPGGRPDPHPRRRRSRPLGRRPGSGRAAAGRPVHGPGRRVLPRRARRAATRVGHRRRDPQHARDRRALPLRPLRAV